jgi:hypothetical protein
MSQDSSHFTWTLGFLAGVAATAATALLLDWQPARAARHKIGRQLRFSAGSLAALRERAGLKAREIPGDGASVPAGDYRRPVAPAGDRVALP